MSSSSNSDQFRLSNFTIPDFKTAVLQTEHALAHGYKNIVDLSNSWNTEHTWLADFHPCSNVVHLTSFFSLNSWINLILPKQLKYLRESDLSELKIIGTVYIPVGQYFAVTKPLVMYNVETENIEIHFEKINEAGMVLLYDFKINKDYLLKKE